eukprot:11719180-Ditylum_brightwellii.AAC.1
MELSFNLPDDANILQIVEKFATLFYVCPVGVGRSRSLSSGILLKIQRWVFTITITDFLDQDTYLLVTQQKNLLVNEANELHHMMNKQSIDANNTENAKQL